MISVQRNIILDEKFWRRFVKTSWEKKPAVFKNAKSKLLEIGADQVFDWLVEYSDHCRQTKTAVGLKFYIDGESQYQNEVLQVLPVKKDKSLVGYHSRMQKLFPDYCLVCDELIQVSRDKWAILGDFMNGLYRQTGFPNRQSEIGLYLGNYKKTPFGVHVDGCGVFSIPVVGVKKFRLWEPAYVKKNPDLELAFDYKPHLKASSLMQVTPGDITYWPSSSWHIAESDGSFSATWSLGLWVDQDYSEIVMQALQGLIIPALKQSATKKYIQFQQNAFGNGLIKNLPDQMATTVHQIAGLTKNQLEDLFMKNWLMINSKNGFKSPVKANRKLKLKMTDKIQGDPLNPIVWAPLKDGRIYLAAHGQLFDILISKSHSSIIEKLNSGKPVPVKTILGQSSDAADLFKILANLYRLQKISLSKK